MASASETSLTILRPRLSGAVRAAVDGPSGADVLGETLSSEFNLSISSSYRVVRTNALMAAGEIKYSCPVGQHSDERAGLARDHSARRNDYSLA
jgi:hypothetical protein